MTPDDLDATALAFLEERHLATLSVPRADGSVQVTPVGITWSDDRILRVIASAGSAKARHIAAAPGVRVTACQVDGPRWIALEGPAVVTADPERVALAVERYAARYREPRPNPERIAIEVSVDRITGRW